MAVTVRQQLVGFKLEYHFVGKWGDAKVDAEVLVTTFLRPCSRAGRDSGFQWNIICPIF